MGSQSCFYIIFFEISNNRIASLFQSLIYCVHVSFRSSSWVSCQKWSEWFPYFDNWISEKKNHDEIHYFIFSINKIISLNVLSKCVEGNTENFLIVNLTLSRSHNNFIRKIRKVYASICKIVKRKIYKSTQVYHTSFNSRRCFF